MAMEWLFTYDMESDPEYLVQQESHLVVVLSHVILVLSHVILVLSDVVVFVCDVVVLFDVVDSNWASDVALFFLMFFLRKACKTPTNPTTKSTTKSTTIIIIYLPSDNGSIPINEIVSGAINNFLLE